MKGGRPKKELSAFVLKMPKKLVGARTEFVVAYTQGGVTTLSITNNPFWTPKVKQIIIVTES